MAFSLSDYGWEAPVCPPTGLLGALLNVVYYGSYGSGNGQFINPYGAAFTPDGSRFIVTDTYNHRVQIL